VGTLTIDSSRCQGHGRCALIDGDVFDVSDEGLGTVLDPQLAATRLDTVQKAIDNCPEQAIGWAQG
jgi:ferredoxin